MSVKTNEQKSEVGLILPDTDSTLPENAIPLTPTEVYRLRLAQMKKWNDMSETWPIVYGPTLGTMAICLSSFVTNVTARQIFNLYSPRSFWPTMGPVMVLPCLVYWIAFDSLITRRILTKAPVVNERNTECELCMELRGSVIQMACGSILPGIITYIGCSIAAVTERSTPVPSLEDPKALWLSMKRFSRGLGRPGSFMLLGHMLLGSALTYAMLNANRTVLMREKQLAGNLATYPPVKK